MTPEDLQALRADFRWTRGQLAQRLGVTYTTVYRWEKGRPVPASYVRLMRILKMFGGRK